MTPQAFTELKEKQVQEFIQENVPASILESNSVLNVYRWAKKYLTHELGSLSFYSCKDRQGFIYFSFSKAAWSSDQVNNFKTTVLKEAIIYSIAEYFCGF